MLKIVSGEQMAAIDRIAIQEQGIPGDTLMENAGQGVVQFILQQELASSGDRVAILCGKGNNGGDGLVIARGLYDAGINPQIFLFAPPEQLKGDAALNWKRLPQILRQYAFEVNPDAGPEDVPAEYLDSIEKSAIVVDALFGTGLQGPLAPNWDHYFEPLKSFRNKVLAVDIASGVNSNDGSIPGANIDAQWTVTMGLPKIGQLVQPGMDATGYLKVIDIGFPQDLTAIEEGDAVLLEPRDIEPLLPLRNISAHKGTAGRLLVLAGSTGFTGAAALCSEAALVGGAGLVTLGIPEVLNPILEIKLTEVMTLPLPQTDKGGLSEAATEQVLEFAEHCSALALGPGLGRDPSTGKLVRNVIREYSGPVVLDADGIFAVKTDPQVLHHKDIIMTPHPGELAAFLDLSIDKVQKRPWEIARNTAEQYGITLILKGAKSVIVSPDGEVRINPTGNPAMASGGLGDVLTGLIAAFLAQGVPAFQAAEAGVFCHGLAADLFVNETGYSVSTAREILEWCREAIRTLTLKEWNRIQAPHHRRWDS